MRHLFLIFPALLVLGLQKTPSVSLQRRYEGSERDEASDKVPDGVLQSKPGSSGNAAGYGHGVPLPHAGGLLFLEGSNGGRGGGHGHAV